MAQPHVAGAAALFTDWWQRTRGGARPSPALVKAALVNGARDLADRRPGPPARPRPAPNSDEGFGLVDLDASVRAGARRRCTVDETRRPRRRPARSIRLELFLRRSRPGRSAPRWSGPTPRAPSAPARPWSTTSTSALEAAGGLRGNGFATG